MSPSLPPEIWAQIAQYCSPRTLKSLSLVCRTCCLEALKRLYQSVQFCEGRFWHSPESTPERTRVVDLALFHRSLNTWSGWQDAVQDVRFEWGNGVKDAFSEPRQGPETEAQSQLNDLVRDTANLLSQSRNLRLLHLSLPRLNSTVPFVVGRLNSLKIPITCGTNEREDPGFATLLKLFQLPFLNHVEIDSMLRLCCVVPDSCRQPGTSNVKELKFIQSGPISEELIDVLRWPKDLQSLEFDVAFSDERRAWTAPNATVESRKMINTLSPLKHSLRNLRISIWEMDGGPYQGGAFQAFSKLQRLRVPRNLFLELSDESTDPDYDIAPSISTQLPKSLQELHIEHGSDLVWRNEEEEEDEAQDELHQNARELFALLSGLAEAKASRFPELHELHLWHEDYDYRLSANAQPCYFPPVCDGTKRFVECLRESGIEVFFNGVNGGLI